MVKRSKLHDAQIWSPVAGRAVPLSQFVLGYESQSENSIIRRRNRLPCLTVRCDPKEGQASTVFRTLRTPIEERFEELVEQRQLSGYTLEWGGEYEDSGDAQAALMGKMPVVGLLMVLVVIFLFNAIRQPLIIFLTVPLSIIGVTAGLLVADQPFGFMALLGFMSLAGMLIKNAIVLIDEIDAQKSEDKQPFDAIVDAGVSRLRPVSMAALTTVLGRGTMMVGQPGCRLVSEIERFIRSFGETFGRLERYMDEMYATMHEETRERQLVERARSGDRQAFEQLCLNLRERLLATIRGRLGSAARQGTDPEDVLQASFAKALHSMQRFEWRGDGSFRRWLESIAIHVTLDAVRHQGRRTVLRIDRDLTDDGTSPSKGIRRRERLDRLEVSMKALSPDYRTVLRLSRMDGLSIKEIANQMGRTESAVKNLLLRATKQLRQSFGDTESLNLGDGHFEDTEAADGS